MIRSDYHIHSEYSYDASLTLDEIVKNARAQGLVKVGITDHVNYNNRKFLGDLKASAEAVNEARGLYPELVPGVELTPIAKPQFDYIRLHGDDEGFVFPKSEQPYGIELAATKEEMIALGVRYAIGAAHWRVDVAPEERAETDLQTCIREWHRQQMFLATDSRVTVLGHPWWRHGKGLWNEDFSLIPRSMHEELAAALKENGKYAECNVAMVRASVRGEKFVRQYAEFLRLLFEAGVPITYGSDAHGVYHDRRAEVSDALLAAGFADGDISEIAEKDLW